ncbi:MAG: hypothetical protein KF724_02015 [Phycisphaeraceae bacterium]|nr:hypothetical protein [Phycisphaeraceae bacterium]
MPTHLILRRGASAVLALAVTHGTVMACPPDLDGSGVIDGADLALLLGAWGGSGPADLDGNGTVDGADLAILLGEWGTECPTEPVGIRSIQLAGRPLSQFPWFDFVQSFNFGAPVRFAVDTLRMPELIGATADVYITAPRSAAEWQLNPTLTDVRGFEQPVTFVAGGVLPNTISLFDSTLLLATDGTNFGRSYDLVIDLNRNGILDDGDLIDGFGDTPGFTVLSNFTLNGPYAVTNPADYTVAGATSGFTSQRLWYPSNLASLTPRPIVVISHGNGHSYTWYNYLGSFLASWGYVVISHQNNTVPGIETASTTTLQHTAALINQQATIAGGVLNGKLDASTIVWIGHSRGGEGVVRAFDRLFDGTYTPPSNAYSKNSIKQLISIAPTDFLGKGGPTTGSDPHDVPFFLIYGAADGDVCGCPGNNVAHSFNLYERSVGEHWSTYIHGADHNDFNCCGPNDFSGPAGTALGTAAVQALMKVHTLVAIKSTLEGSPAARELRWRRYASLRPLGVSTSAIVRNDESRLGSGTIAVIDDFQTQTSVTMSSSGGVVSPAVESLTEGIADDNNSSFTWLTTDPFNGQTRVGVGDSQRAIVFAWTAPASITWSITEPLKDFSGAVALGFRAAQGTRHPSGTAADATFTVTLVDHDGVESTISLVPYSKGLGRTYQRTGFGTGAGWQNELQLVRLRLDDFRRHGNAIDLSRIATIRMNFGGAGETSTGRIVIDDLSLLAE